MKFICCCFMCLAKSKRVCDFVKLRSAILFKPWTKMDPEEFKYITFDGETAKFNWIISNYKLNVLGTDDLSVSVHILAEFYCDKKFMNSGGIIKFCKIEPEDKLSQVCKINIKEGIYGNGQKFMWNIVYIDHELREMRNSNSNMRDSNSNTRDSNSNRDSNDGGMSSLDKYKLDKEKLTDLLA